MQRTLVLVALASALLPALAYTAGQTPLGGASAHPAASAHANAVAGQANAARIEACGNLSHAMLGALTKGDYKGATANFDSQMASGLDPQKLEAAWSTVGAQFGKLESQGTPQAVMYQGMPVVTTPLHFAKGNLAAQVACGKDGKIAGFHIQPIPPATSG
ncbi:MAG TPA: DUF3887 domain-containing protein [Rhodanobacteraceae bacterium]